MTFGVSFYHAKPFEPISVSELSRENAYAQAISDFHSQIRKSFFALLLNACLRACDACAFCKILFSKSSILLFVLLFLSISEFSNNLWLMLSSVFSLSFRQNAVFQSSDYLALQRFSLLSLFQTKLVSRILGIHALNRQAFDYNHVLGWSNHGVLLEKLPKRRPHHKIRFLIQWLWNEIVKRTAFFDNDARPFSGLSESRYTRNILFDPWWFVFHKLSTWIHGYFNLRLESTLCR